MSRRDEAATDSPVEREHAGCLLLWELENGFEMSPKQSGLVFETARGVLLEHDQMERGKVAGVGVGGWLDLKSAPAPLTSDHDGMPDSWEIRHGLNPRGPTDGPRFAVSGYSNLEMYLNSIVKRK